MPSVFRILQLWLFGFLLIAPLFAWGQDSKQKISRYAFIVGINEYSNEPDLSYCEADAERLKIALHNGGFEGGNVEILVGKDKPSETEIVKRLETLLEKIDDKSENLLLFSFSGHGFQDENNKRYLCPYDANRQKSKGLLDLEEIFTLLKDAKKIHHCVCLIDACRSPINQDKGTRSSPNRNPLSFTTMKLPEDLNLFILSGCEDGNVSREYPELQQGLFTHYVVEGLEGLAKNRNGEVDGHNLFSFVKTGMETFSSQRGSRQTPTISVSLHGEQTANVAITEPRGVSHWPKRPANKGEFFWTFADLVQFPGLSGQWWGEEIPWYLPFVRLAVARRLENLHDPRDLDIYCVESFGMESSDRKNYHVSDVAESYGWLHTKATERSIDFLSKEAKDLMETIVSYNTDGTFDGGKQGENYAMLAEKCEKLSGQSRDNPVQYSVLLHSQAVLQHLAILNGKGEIDYIVKTDSLYDEALQEYMVNDPKKKAPLTFVHLCMSDYIRFLRLIEGKKDNAGHLIGKRKKQELIDSIRGDVAASRAWQSPLFYLELLTTIASYSPPGSAEAETLFSRNRAVPE